MRQSNECTNYYYYHHYYYRYVDVAPSPVNTSTCQTRMLVLKWFNFIFFCRLREQNCAVSRVHGIRHWVIPSKVRMQLQCGMWSWDEISYIIRSRKKRRDAHEKEKRDMESEWQLARERGEKERKNWMQKAFAEKCITVQKASSMSVHMRKMDQ